MSTDSMHKVVRLDETELQQLTKEVKETLAENLQPKKKKANSTFTAAEMWRHQSRVRSASMLVRRWNKK